MPLRRRLQLRLPNPSSPTPRTPLLWFAWTPKTRVRRRAVLVEPSPFVVAPRLNAESTLGSFVGALHRTEVAMLAFHVLRRHCRVSPQRRVNPSRSRPAKGGREFAGCTQPSADPRYRSSGAPSADAPLGAARPKRTPPTEVERARARCRERRSTQQGLSAPTPSVNRSPPRGVHPPLVERSAVAEADCTGTAEAAPGSPPGLSTRRSVCGRIEVRCRSETHHDHPERGE
jgi:hypothetical protein